MCHTRELAFQIKNEYDRFAKYMDNVRTSVFFGGVTYVLSVNDWMHSLSKAFWLSGFVSYPPLRGAMLPLYSFLPVFPFG